MGTDTGSIYFDVNSIKCAIDALENAEVKSIRFYPSQWIDNDDPTVSIICSYKALDRIMQHLKNQAGVVSE